MPKERLLIIGGVAAGMSAASRARKLAPELEILVLEKGADVAYGACGLPYLLSGRVRDPRELVVYSADFFREKRSIDVHLHHEAVEIEPGRRRVHALAPGSRPVVFNYDKLIVTTGGAPITDLPGADLPQVFTCNDLAGAVRLRAFLDEHQPKRGIVVGSGYIGLEVADALTARGLSVTILERSAEVLEGVEPGIAEKVEETLATHSVRLIKSATVNAISGDERGPVVAQFGAAGGEKADLVVLATGIRPRAALAEAAGIQLGSTGAIAVDDRMQTSVNGIYAAGDCAETIHLVTGKPTYFPLGTTANKQGRVAGENAAGGNARFAGIVGTLVTQVFQLEIACTGLSMEQARAAGFQPDSVTVTSVSRAKYFGGKPIVVTLIWDRESARLLGCQMCGEEGAAKRIDVAAMALHARMRIPDMLHLDLGYAPPFAPVWEGILVAANEAHKKLTGR